MDIAMHDQKLQHMKCELKDRKKKLFKKFLLLKNNENENKFLGGIVDDYHRYYDYIVGQKKEQIEALGIIAEYLDRITLETKLTDAALEKAKRDQKEILGEMDAIKDDLDEIISGVNVNEQ